VKTSTNIKRTNQQKIEAVGIGSSLGGPKALEQILSELPKDLPVPIFIAQHVTSGFSLGLVEWLQSKCQLKIQIAKHMEKAIPGHVYIPPDNLHMEVSKDQKIVLVSDSKITAHPSIAKLFNSLANNYGPRALGIILTGMGEDGAKELLLMREKGAITIAQDEESSTMYGMPQAATKLNAATYVINLRDIAEAIKKHVMINAVI
jgi:two-component system chemotaxis response regulator CheB